MSQRGLSEVVHECECVGEATRYSGIFHLSGMVPGIHGMMPFVDLVDVSFSWSYHLECHKYLFIPVHFFRSHSILSHPLTPIHSFVLYSKSTPQRQGRFLAPGRENMHRSSAALALGRPNHISSYFGAWCIRACRDEIFQE